MTPSEAADHLKQIIEQVNVVVGSLFQEELMRAAENASENKGL